MKALLFTTALLSSTAAFANNCNVDFNGNIELSNEQIRIITEDDKNLFIDAQQQLWVNNQAVNLTASQQSLVSDYYQQLYQAAPKAADIALDAVDLARDGVTLAFSELLGSDHDLVIELDETLYTLKADLQHKFYPDNGSLYFSTGSGSGGDFLDKEFEQRLEESIESAVKRSMGSLMIAIGQDMLFGDGDMNSFEQRMERLGETIETQVEGNAEALEARADELCYDLVQLDTVEQQLQQQVPELAQLNVIEVKKYDKQM